MVSRTVVTCSVMALLFFMSTCIASILLAFAISSKVFSIALGSIVLVLGVAFIALGFFKNDEGKMKWQCLFIGFVSIFAGALLTALKPTFHVEDSKINKISIYTIVLISLTSILSVVTTFISNKTITDALKSANMDHAQEMTLYIVLNSLISLLVAVMFCIKVLKANASVWTTDFTLSIAIWFLAAIFGGCIGYIYESKSTPLASAYNSNYDTNSYDNIK